MLMMQAIETALRVTAEALKKLQEISQDPGFAGKVVRIRPVGIT